MTGTAEVTWSATEHSRHVVHELNWTRLSDGRTGTGSGDRTETLVDPNQGLLGGIRIDGNRHWSGQRGQWDLAITGVEVPPAGPGAEAGSYHLTTPVEQRAHPFVRPAKRGRHCVTVTGPKHEFSFSVRETGAVFGQLKSKRSLHGFLRIPCNLPVFGERTLSDVWWMRSLDVALLSRSSRQGRSKRGEGERADRVTGGAETAGTG